MRAALFVVTPVGNEAAGISTFLDSLREERARGDLALVWIPVFDHVCTDGTDRFVRSAASREEWIQPVWVEGPSSLTRAYLTGFEAALDRGATHIVECDVGHPTHAIPLIAQRLDRHPVVYSTRYGHGSMENVRWWRRLLSRLGTRVSRGFLGVRCSDGTGGLIGYRDWVLRAVLSRAFLSHGHFYQTEMKHLLRDIDFAEMPIRYRGQKSSLRLRTVLAAAWNTWCLIIGPHEPVEARLPVPCDRPTTALEALECLKDAVMRAGQCTLHFSNTAREAQGLQLALLKWIELELAERRGSSGIGVHVDV